MAAAVAKKEQTLDTILKKIIPGIAEFS